MTARLKVALLLLLPFALRVLVAGADSATPGPVHLKVVLMPYFTFAPLLLAKAEGYFAEQGLDVEFVSLTGSIAAVPALVQGELDVLPGSITPAFLNAMARGAKIRFVADKGYFGSGCPFFGLLARRGLVEEGKLSGAAQLRGLRISATATTPSEYYLDKLLAPAGLTITDIRMVNVPDAAEVEALKNGSLDLAIASDPSLTRTVQTGAAVLWHSAEQVIPDFQYAFIVFGPSLIEKNPDAGKRFMVAYLKAVRQYNQGKTDHNVEILAAQTGLDRELLKQSCWAPIHNDGRVNESSIADFQAWAVRKGLLDKPVAKDQFWDPRFIDYANQVLDQPGK